MGLPRDFTKLFDERLFGFGTELVPEAAQLYGQLGVKKGPLTLIAPQFEAPLPPLQPAVFPPQPREPPPPPLDLFDLDEQFAGEAQRLAALANKCSEGKDEDLEFFIREGAIVLGLPEAMGDTILVPGEDSDAAPPAPPDAPALLAAVFQRLVEYK